MDLNRNPPLTIKLRERPPVGLTNREPSRFFRLRLILFAVWVSGIPSAFAGEMDADVKEFLQRYCIECHGPDTQQADFRVDRLKISSARIDAEYWQMVLDNLNLGEMPPEGERQPPAKEIEAVTSWIDAELRRAQSAFNGSAGEVVLRRLNRTEYEYTIEDLFGVRGDLTSGFPADVTADGFDNNGAALTLSGAQMEAYLEAADNVLDRAIETGPRPTLQRAAFTLHDFNEQAWENHQEKLARRKENFSTLTPNEQQRTREMIQQLEENPHAGFAFPVIENGKLRFPTPEDGEGVDGVIATRAGYAAPDTRRHFRVQHPGWYRFAVSAYGVRCQSQPVRLKIRYGSFRQGTIPKIADVWYLNEGAPQKRTYRLYLQPRDLIKLELLDGENWARREDQVNLPGPFVAIRKMEMEGPLIDQWPPAGHQALLGPRQADQLSDAVMPEILSELAPKLFRRPVSSKVVDDYATFYRSLREQAMQPLEAFKLTAKAMLTSPHFLYHVEPPDGPDDHAIANRLSYFLWRSVPDAELTRLAESKELSSPEVLRGQVNRMLDHPKSERFVNDFLGQWLGIDQVGQMQPDAKLYPEYDAELERSMVGQTRTFFSELIKNDLSVMNLIHSDWAMLNARLAEHYGIDGVDGNAFRRVNLNRDSVRGGLLTQASVLNVTSNGTTTSPVVRGVWILERLLGTPPSPPPPDVPAIEPDIRGASTIQEQLEKHRSIQQCGSCHRKIDPYGFALENFDVIGGWRQHYRALQPTPNPNRPKLVDGPKVISNDTLPGMRTFELFREFRTLLLDYHDLVYQNGARQLAVFALGRPLEFSDRETLRQVLKTTRDNGGGLKTMNPQLLTSPLLTNP